MNVFEVANLLVELTRRDYADDVGLVVYYGSHATGTATERSDLDLYYIPDENTADGLYRSVLLEGLAFEFWGVSWEFATRIAEARYRWSVAPSIIANAQVLHARSSADRDRFRGLQDRIKQLQQPEQHAYMLSRALETFEKAPFALDKLRRAVKQEDWPGARLAAFQTLDVLIDCLALVNQTFCAKYWAADLSQLAILTLQPEKLCERLSAITTGANRGDSVSEVQALLDDTRAILLEQQSAAKQPFEVQQVFAGYYPGIKEYLNKIVSACERHDLVAATAAAVQIQKDVGMMIAQCETGIAYSEFNAFGEYRAAVDRLGFPDLAACAASGDFSRLIELTDEFDRRSRDYLTAHGVALNDTQTLEELRALLGL